MKNKKTSTRKINNKLIFQISVFVMIGTIGLFLWQSSASMQSRISENNASENREVLKDFNPVTNEPSNAVASPSCSTLAYATTLRFPGGGVTENQLISFNTSTPGTIISDVAVQGLNTAISEYMPSIDIRPATGELYGLIVQNDGAASGTIRVVKVDPATGATTPVGTAQTVANPGNFNGIDFNPVVDRLRITQLQTAAAPGIADLNFRVHPDTGVFTPDTGLRYNAGDTGAGTDEFIIANAYTNNVVGATQTTLYGIDSQVDRLVRIGSINGTPNSPNGGLVDTVGPLGVNTSGIAEMDIASDGVAYAILDTITGTGAFGSPGRLYTIDLTTGAATLVAPIGGLSTRFHIGLAVTACPTGPVISSTGPTITAETFTPANMSPDPGETITVSLPITNNGGGPTTNLTATLQATSGVTNPTPASQNYGAIAAGQTVSRSFTFTVSPGLACGDPITLTFNVADGATNYTPVTKTYTTGANSVSLSQNFDAVTAPALPAGWTSVQTTGTDINWVTTTTTPASAPNAAFANDPAAINATALVSPAVTVGSASAQLTFQNKYITESTFDGAVLEFSTDGGTTYTDIITGGGTFVSGGYNATISTGFMSPIAGRMAWSGTSAGGYLTTTVSLPASLNGQSVKFRWLMASDSSVTSTGIWIDDVQVLGSRVCSMGGDPPADARADFDGDGKTDLSVFRPSDGNWYLNRSTAGFAVVNFGLSTDTPVPGDYDGDNKTDIAVYRGTDAAGSPDFYILNSSNSTLSGPEWGISTDIPVVGDYDGDGKADGSVFRPSTNTWYILKSGGGVTITVFGQAGDTPLVADWDGDGKSDLSLRRGNTWLAMLSGGGTVNVDFGQAGDLAVQADYDGDGKDDIAVFRPSTGEWFAMLSSNSTTINVQFGLTGDVPVPGDYDGDGKDDQAIYRNGQWWVNGSTSGVSVRVFGLSSDKPIPNEYLP